MTDKPKSNVTVIKLYQVRTWQRELWSDLSTFSVIVGVCAIGWFFESSAMQWLGLIVLLLVIANRASGRMKKFCPQEAANWLKDEYGVRAE